jgi:hypothetical protein
VRVFAALAAVGILLGVAAAHALRGRQRVEARSPCTAAWIGLVPKISLDESGTSAHVGFSAPGPAGCHVPTGGPRGAGVRIESADGRLLLRRSGAGGPPPGTLIESKLLYSVGVPALELCQAPQPLKVTVWVIGLTASGEGRLRFAGGRCLVGS